MNIFNRIMMILLILLGLAVLGFMLYASMYVQLLDVAREELDFFKESLLSDTLFYYAFVAACLLVGLVLLVLFVLEVRRPRYKMVRIKSAGGGDARLAVQSVAQSLEYRIDELPGVRAVQPRIISRGGDVEVMIGLDTSPSVNIPVLTAQISDLCQEIVESQLGLKLHGRVRLNIRHEPYARGTTPARGRPVQAVTPATAMQGWASVAAATAEPRPVAPAMPPVQPEPVSKAEPASAPIAEAMPTDDKSAPAGASGTA